MKFLPTEINLPHMKINTVEKQSSVSFGQNYKTNRYVTCKRQQGFGEQNGDRVITHHPIQGVVDADFSDNEVK
ncbi:hypothetical protein [Halobacillus sp. BBL2006]|uniref:hypothetical protein n=1 Tax=Halobacillus sp. BBL2006 TaxID=1543706 RepID=UPI0005419742|nr:hypothetical protein [Halobacillus sp. BBL2006]KHE67456.1 hypothetical protein LD39_17455 [Halobacillus sp. BBL2006]